ncbi:MAG: acyl-CoA dehydrogenase family protein [Dermatophilaceae bacterium]
MTTTTLPGLDTFRATVREVLHEHATPHHDAWEREGRTPREFWRAAGAGGLLAPAAPPELGGAGLTDPRYAAAVAEELVRAGLTAPGIVAHNDVATSYVLGRGSSEQRRRWMPGLVTGECVAAIAITEPGGGSDVAAMATTARRDGDHYVLDGRKSFITNGETADLVVVAARTGDGPRGLSLVVVERGTPGLTRGEQLPTLGWRANDTCDLRFDGCRVPAANLLGSEGAATAVLMRALPAERVSIATVAVTSAEMTLAAALTHARTRTAFGGPIGSLQHNRFVLATLDTEVTIARVFLDHCLAQHAAGRLSVADAAKAKWWCTELQTRVADRAVQLLGGRGYLDDNPVSREWLNSRVQTIYGGPTEVMKELIGRSLGL